MASMLRYSRWVLSQHSQIQHCEQSLHTLLWGISSCPMYLTKISSFKKPCMGLEASFSSIH